MNSTTWLIIKKDMRRYWGLLVLWCAALLLRVSMGALIEAEMPSGREEAMFAMILVMLVNVLLVVRVIGEDSPFKEAAFWRTRPISGGQMLRAKLLLLGGWTVVLPCVVAAVGSRYYGFTLSESLGVVTGQFMLHAMIGAGFAVCALFTQRALVTLFGIWLVASVVQAVSQVWWRGAGGMNLGDVGPESASLAMTQVVLIVVVLVLACGAAAAWVYGRRSRSGAAGFLVLGVVGGALVNGYWRVDLLSAVPALARLEARGDERYGATVTRVSMDAGSTVDEVSFRHVSAAVKWSGAEADEVYALHQVEGRLSRPDGREFVQFHAVESEGAYDLTAALRRLGIDRVVSRSSWWGDREAVTLMKLRPAELETFKAPDVTWSGRVVAKIGRIEAGARVPLRSGAVYRNGAVQLRVNKVEVGGAELKVVFVERSADTPRLTKRANSERAVSGVMPHLYALINVAKGEALIANGGGAMGGSSDGFFQYGRRTLSFGGKSGNSGTSDFRTEEWAEWLRGAELVSFRFVEERRVKVPVSVPVEIK